MNPHTKYGFHFQDVLKGTWDEQGNSVNMGMYDTAQGLFIQYINQLGFALEEKHGVSILGKKITLFPEFSYAFISTRARVILVLGKGPLQAIRFAIYQSIGNNNEFFSTTEEVVKYFETNKHWSDIFVSFLPSLSDLAAPDQQRREQIIKQVASSDSNRIIEQYLPTQQQVDNNLCFIIMSFSGNPQLQDFYEMAVKPTVESLGFRCERVDEQQFNTSIRERINDNIKRAKFIIADMTEARPNCYYELGVAHTMGKEVIHLVRDINDVHFDIRDFNFIVYNRIDQLSLHLHERIIGTISNNL